MQLFIHKEWITVIGDCSPFEHGPAGGLLDHEENPPALEGPCYSPTGHLLPPLPDRVEGSRGTCGNGNFIGSFCEPGPIFNTVQHIVWSHNPLSWLGEKQQQQGMITLKSKSVGKSRSVR